jgi:hypothetical protein
MDQSPGREIGSGMNRRKVDRVSKRAVYTSTKLPACRDFATPESWRVHKILQPD